MTLTPQDAEILRRRQGGPTTATRGHGEPGRRPLPVRRERDIQRAILDYLKTVPGVVAWKTGGGLLPLADGRRVRMGRAGVSDIIGWQTRTWCPHGYELREGNHLKEKCTRPIARFLAIEVKRPGRRATEVQMNFLDAVVRDGGIACLASSVEDVARALGMTR